MTERYEKGSLVITSNRAFEEWGEVFANDLLASAALDRLTHHSHLLVIRGNSYRQRSRVSSGTLSGGVSSALSREEKEIVSIKSDSDALINPES